MRLNWNVRSPHSVVARTIGTRFRPVWKTHSSVLWSTQSERTSQIFVSTPARDHREGIHADASRPSHVRDDAWHSADSTHVVRLRDQFRSATFACRRASRGPGCARSNSALCDEEHHFL